MKPLTVRGQTEIEIPVHAPPLCGSAVLPNPILKPGGVLGLPQTLRKYLCVAWGEGDKAQELELHGCGFESCSDTNFVALGESDSLIFSFLICKMGILIQSLARCCMTINIIIIIIIIPHQPEPWEELVLLREPHLSVPGSVIVCF